MLSKRSSFLKLVGDKSRLTLLRTLASSTVCVSELVDQTKLSQSLISHHLKDLKDGGLVTGTRDGKWVHYTLTAKGQRVTSDVVALSSSLLKLIGDESRLKLLSVIRTGTHCVSELIERTKLSQSLISHHLRDFRDEGLFRSRRDGKWMYYLLTEKGQRIASLVNSL